MISRRRLDRLEAMFNPPSEQPSPDRDLQRARRAGAAGTWSWDDARLLLAERAADARDALVRNAASVRRYPLETLPDFYGAWAMQIVCRTLDEEVPLEPAQKLLRAILTPDGVRRRPIAGDDCDPDAYEAAAMILALETPDAYRLRHEIWTPTPTAA